LPVNLLTQIDMAITTLILGAGLGKEYGYPDGKELRTLTINELGDHDQELRKILEWYPADTVDEIVADHPNYADQLRRIVIKILYDRENHVHLKQNKKPNTYGLMLKQIANAQIKGEKVNIITFNYDRSLQYLLFQVNSVAPENRKINPAIITPIYGRLPPLFYEDPNRGRAQKYHDYGEEFNSRVNFQPFEDGYEDHFSRQLKLQERNDLSALWRASNVFFIGETKAPKPEIVGDLLEESDQIFFLGVGYHKANMDILEFDFSQRHSGKIIAGTGLGLGQETVVGILETYPAINKIENCDAETFLKSKFNITGFEKNILKSDPSMFDVI
jgi:hypothetical protein